MGELKLTETTPSKNWPAGKRPEWVDERTRLYTGCTITAAAQEWSQIVVHFDGEATTAYLTHAGFDLDLKGPAIHKLKGETGQYRKVVSEFFRDFCFGDEVVFT
jgi:hypothetical protein